MAKTAYTGYIEPTIMKKLKLGPMKNIEPLGAAGINALVD